MLLRLLLPIVAALMVSGAAFAAPLEAYGRLPNIEDIALSPDGTMVALVVTDGETRRVVISRIGERTPIAILNGGEQKLRSITWAGDDHVLITTSTTGVPRDVISDRGEWFITLDFNLRTRSQRHLFRNVERAMNVTAGGPYVRVVDGRTVVILVGYEFPQGGGRSRLSLFRTDPNSNSTAIIESGGRDTQDWAVDEQGRPVGVLQVIDHSGEWRIEVRTAAGSWRVAAGAPAYNSAPTLYALGRDGQSLLVAGREGDRNTLREVSLATGAWSQPIGDGEPAGVLIDPVTHRFAGLRYLEGDEYRATFFNPTDEREWNAIQRAFPGQLAFPVSFSRDRRRIIVLVDSPTEGPAYSLVDFNTGRATWIGPVYASIREADISPVRYITYAAGDGLQIGGYLTLPRGRDPRGLPLIVLPHGGPESRDTRGFDWWSQALASRGYAVLQPNFRGSAGYGYAFVRAGHGQWGRKMQTDLSDGVAHLAREGIIDRSRVCIVGASYGGYAAMAGVTLQRGVYRCAASFGGVSDPGSLVRYSRNRTGQESQRYWFEFMGVTGQRDPDLAAISPLAHAGDASAPLLLIHGRDDTVVPFSQSEQMAAALRRAGHPVELVSLPSEDHWLSRGDTRLRMLTEIVRFLETHNPPGPAPASSAARAAAPAAAAP